MIQQPVRVLCSNAPPLRDIESVNQASRVLQAQSGQNPYSVYANNASFGAQIYPAPPFHPITPWPAQCQTLPPQLYAHPPNIPQHHLNWNYPGRGNYQHELRAKNEAAKRLQQHFRATEGYAKYRSRLCNSSDKKGTEEKWSDNVEDAFFRALVEYPPMGRKQKRIDETQYGRNELISAYIKEVTGEVRNRKQVSSHIQVLKAFIAHDPFVMRFFSCTNQAAGAEQRGPGAQASNYVGSRRPSHCPVTSPPTGHAGANVWPPAVRPVGPGFQRLKDGLAAFELTDFSMFVQRSIADRVDRLHTYTQSLQPPLSPEILHLDAATLGRDYPRLAAMHASAAVSANVLIADCSLAIPQTTYKDQYGNSCPEIELGIYYHAISRYLPSGTRIKYSSNFFRGNELMHKCEEDAQLMDCKDINGHPLCAVEGSLKFGSTFWAGFFIRLGSQPVESATKEHKEHKERVISEVQNLTAVQEFFAIRGTMSYTPPERLLTIYWTFRLSSAAKGKTSWCKAVLPTNASTNSFSSASPYPEMLKPERADSVYDNATPDTPIDFSASQTQSTYASLQSPFEYESTSAGSALPWSASMGDVSSTTAFSSHPEFSADQSFDFPGGNIHMSYDDSMDFGNPAYYDDETTIEFAADPTLDQYSQESQPWSESYATSFLDSQSQQTLDSSVHSSFAAPAAHMDPQSQGQLYGSFDGSFSAAHSYDASQDEHFYGSTDEHEHEHERQAYGGAGKVSDGVVEGQEDALAALADVSCAARGLGVKDESSQL